MPRAFRELSERIVWPAVGQRDAERTRNLLQLYLIASSGEDKGKSSVMP